MGTDKETQVSPGGDEITPAPNPNTASNKELRDKATVFLEAHGTGDNSFTYEEERAVLRRIDFRILPLLLGAYFFQQLDKSSLRYVSSSDSIPTGQQQQLTALLLAAMSPSLASPKTPTSSASNTPGSARFSTSHNSSCSPWQPTSWSSCPRER